MFSAAKEVGLSLCQKEQHEEEAILRFASYLQNTTGVSYGVTGRDVPVPSGQNYDYELTGADGDKLAVELFRLVESEQDLKRERAWNLVIRKLKEEIARRKLKGYMVSTPVFMYKKKELDAYVSRHVRRPLKRGRLAYSSKNFYPKKA